MKKKLVTIALLVSLLTGIHVATAAPTETIVQNLKITDLSSNPTSSLVVGSNGRVSTSTISTGGIVSLNTLTTSTQTFATSNTTSLPSTLSQQNPRLSTKTLNENEPGWRELILSHDMESVWRRLAGLAQSQSASQWDLGDKTQDVFLHLLSERRLSTYVDENWSEAEIMGDLLSLM